MTGADSALLTAFSTNQGGGIPYPLPAPSSPIPVAPAHHNNIPDASVPRQALPDRVPIVDYTGGQFNITGHQQVRTQHLPPTNTGGQADVPPSSSQPAGSVPAPLAAPPIQPLVPQTPAPVQKVNVQFGLPTAGGGEEEFFCDYLAVNLRVALLVFVSPTGTRTWFPADRDEPIAVRIGDQKLVHLARVLPMAHDFGGYDFRFMLSLEQRAIE